jgi:hypothetical protein
MERTTFFHMYIEESNFGRFRDDNSMVGLTTYLLERRISDIGG